MTNVIRRWTSSRQSKPHGREKPSIQNNWIDKSLMKERDKLLHEFLTARKELKEQFDIEKTEIINNYERRNRYLRRLLEQCDENINMLKLDLDAEKEENYSLKTRVIELENLCMKNDVQMNPSSYNNNSFEDDSTLTCDEDISMKSPLSVNRVTSSISGLKYSDRSSSDSLYKQSISSLSSISSDVHTEIDVRSGHDDLHRNCREEFTQLLEELRNQKLVFEKRLNEERSVMRERIEDEKLQAERIVFKQLNLKLEKEIKKRDLLFTENNFLQQALSRKFSETQVYDSINYNPSQFKESTWKESNSDSGADVEDNHSDIESPTPLHQFKPKCYNVTELINEFEQCGGEQIVSKNSINELLNEQKSNLTNEFQKQLSRERKKFKRIIENLNNQIHGLTKEIKSLRRNSSDRNPCINDITHFHAELTEKLLSLEEILSDPDAC